LVPQLPLLFFSILAVATALGAAWPAYCRVGVTSETDGDPKGKPPVEAERILRMGIDIQAEELITTRQDDRAHLVFLDGTSLTLGPNAQIKIDKFVYDPDKKIGDIAISALTGTFRVVGGKISKSRAITVTSPSAVIGLRGGIALVEVGAQETKAQFLFGTSMVVSAQGRTETASRAGSEIVTRSGGFPSNPVLIPTGSLGGTLSRLEGRPSGSRGEGAPDARARQSGFSNQNSGQNVAPQLSNLLNRAPEAAIDAVSNASVQKIQPASVPPMASVVPLPPAPASLPAPPPPPSIVQNDPWCRDDRFDARWGRDHRHHHPQFR
jgi:hypothetical protein